MPLAALLPALLTLRQSGYRAPKNGVLIAACLIGTAFYVVLAIGISSSGPMRISDALLRRALAKVRL